MEVDPLMGDEVRHVAERANVGDIHPAEEQKPLDKGPLETQLPSPPQPLLRPGVRAVAYLAVCVVVGIIGLVIVSVLYALWSFQQHGFAGIANPQQDMGTVILIAIMTLYPLLILTTFLFVRLVDRRSLSSLGLVKVRWGKDCVSGAAVAIGFVIVTAVTYRLAGWIRLEPQEISWRAWIVATLLAYPLIGFTEELVFRGYLLSTLEEWRGRRGAMVVTSILFWMAHVGYGQGNSVNELIGIPSYLAIGFTFALCRYATGSLWFPIGLHAAYDWLTISLLGGMPLKGIPVFFSAEPTVPHWLVGPPGTGGVIDLAFLFLFVAGVYVFLYRPVRKRELSHFESCDSGITTQANA